MIKYNSNKLSSKWQLSILVLFGALTLSACQTTPLPSASSTPLPITISKQTVIVAAEPQYEATTPQTDSIDNNYPVDSEYQESYPVDDTFEQNSAIESIDNNSYPIEPYIPPRQDPIQYNTDISATESAYEAAVYQQKFETTAEPIVEPDNRAATYKSPASSPMPSMPSHSEMLERARQNSQQQTRQSTSNNSSLPAFRNLMDVGINQLKSGQLTAAENSFTRAQRMAPKSSAVYFYLAQVALKKNQPHKAEAMARRGLVVSEDSNRRRALWQIILQSGQAQNSTRVINEAKQALR
ncbi:MAG: tetratricopeptide repeat protein [Psychrobacter sp.]|nr:tetratricopeptide repeat protein [Psychrobacter sp.]